MIWKWQIRKDVEGLDRDLIQSSIKAFDWREREKPGKNINQGCRCPGLNQVFLNFGPLTTFVDSADPFSLNFDSTDPSPQILCIPIKLNTH